MKVLIWDKELTLMNVGGPAGYLYNIHEYLKEYPNEQIDFYSDVIIKKTEKDSLGGSAPRTIRQWLLKAMMKRKFLSYFIQLKHSYFSRKKLSKVEAGLLSRYDYVHVHKLQCLVHYFLSEHNSTKVIFTTHCPEPFFDEVTASYGMTWLPKLLPNFRNYFLKRECNIIRKADLVMFPVKEAIEPYVIRSLQYENLFKEIEPKMIFVPTSLYPAEKIDTMANPLEKENIPADSLKVCYIGRHNQIKGYDIVKEVAKLAWQKADENIHFVIGGKEAPFYGLKDSRWHELGWVKTVEVLNNVDVFILPNRQTYFDLILLEVLRQGKPCVISDTGGNRWFKQYNLKGVRIFNINDVETVIPVLKYFSEIKRNGGLKELENEIIQFFSSHFSVDIYIQNYLHILSDGEK